MEAQSYGWHCPQGHKGAEGQPGQVAKKAILPTQTAKQKRKVKDWSIEIRRRRSEQHKEQA